jgi:hypothetical protein
MEAKKMARLFKRTTKDGRVYLTGAMSSVSQLVVIENHRKQRDDDPDYYAYVVPTGGVRGEQIERWIGEKRSSE